MSENAEGITLQQLTLLPADFLASLIVWPGSEEARRMTATSGRKCIVSFGNLDRLGYLLRMFLESRELFSTRVYLTWKVKDTGTTGTDGEDTESPRWLFQLAPSMPRIDGNEFSLLPTPTDASKGGGSSRSGDRINETPTLQGMARKGELAMWPTPRASVGMRNKLRTETEIENHQGRLEDAVAMEAQGPGYLNPTWEEWLMGFPLGWSELDESEFRPSGTP